VLVGYSRDSSVVKWLWEILESYSQVGSCIYLRLFDQLLYIYIFDIHYRKHWASFYSSQLDLHPYQVHIPENGNSEYNKDLRV
jgi:hypothetical protein